MGGEDAKLSSKRKQESGPHFPSSVPRETRKDFSILQENSYLVKFDIEFVYIFFCHSNLAGNKNLHTMNTK